MDTHRRKIIASSLIVALVVSITPFSFSPQSGIGVQKTHAQSDSAISSVGGCIANLAAGALSSYFSTSVPTSPGSLNWKECFDGIMKGVANGMKQRLIDSTIQWAKTGFEGDPLFLVNEKRYLQEIADQEALAFINEVGQIAGDAAREVERALVEDQRRTFQDAVRCRLCEDYDEDAFYNDFEGGWDAWFKSAEPGSNSFGGYITSSGRLAQQKRAAQDQVLRDAQRGDGYLSSRACTEQVDIPSDGRVGSGSSYCKSYEIETPGQTVSNAVNHGTGSDVRELELADEMNEVFSAVIQGLITRIANEGLRSVGEGSSSYSNPFATTGSSGGGSTGGSTGTAGESAADDFADSFNPGRSAQADTPRATSNEFPEGAGEGLSGGQTTLQQEPTTSGPETVNLSSETLSDWAYFGLTSAFGSDVERKNIADSQIEQVNIPLGSNISVVAEDAGFDFSWTDGYPQSQGFGESQGLGIAAAGERIEFSVAGGDREQELTLYLGATQAQGQLRVSFPGSGQDDIVADISSQTGTTAQTVTVRFNARANESLNVSYEAQELSPDTDQYGETITDSAYISLYAATVEDAETLYPPEDPTLVREGGDVVVHGGNAITRTGPQTVSGLFSGSWWPGEASATLDIGSSEYVSVPLRTADDFSGNGRVIVSKALGETGVEVVAAALSKYPGDFVSMYETDRASDRNCLATVRKSFNPFITLPGEQPVIATELYWHIAIPPIVGDSPSPVSSSCQLKPNTRYYLNIFCRRVDDSGGVTGSCSDVGIHTTAPGESVQEGTLLRVQTQ